MPLSSGALDVLLRASELAGDSPFVFPTRAGRALSSKSTYRVLQLAGVTGTTLHGFRTSIRGWMAETGVGPRDGGSRVGSRRARHRGRVHEIGPAGAPVRSHAGMERLCRIVRGRMDQGGAQRRRRVHGTPTPNGRRSSFRDWAAEATDHRREVVEAAATTPSRGAAYVEGWVAALEEDPREIRRAAADAQKISDFVLARSREHEAEREPAPVAAIRAPAPRPAGPAGASVAGPDPELRPLFRGKTQLELSFGRDPLVSCRTRSPASMTVDTPCCSCNRFDQSATRQRANSLWLRAVR